MCPLRPLKSSRRDLFILAVKFLTTKVIHRIKMFALDYGQYFDCYSGPEFQANKKTNFEVKPRARYKYIINDISFKNKKFHSRKGRFRKVDYRNFASHKSGSRILEFRVPTPVPDFSAFSPGPEFRQISGMPVPDADPLS